MDHGEGAKLVQQRASAFVAAVISAGALTLATPALCGVPSSVVLGKVYDASTHKPLAGVDVLSISAEIVTEGLPTCASLAVTDSSGAYGLSPCDGGILTFTAPGYRSLQLKLDEMRCQDEGSCCGKLRDIELQFMSGDELQH